MVKDLVKTIDRIFADGNNFDGSGFARPELVTVELAKALGEMTPEIRKKFLSRGYAFHWFNAEATDGLISKEFQRGKLHYFLKLYYNQQYPAEIEKGDTQNGYGHVREGDNQQPEADHS